MTVPGQGWTYSRDCPKCHFFLPFNLLPEPTVLLVVVQILIIAEFWNFKLGEYFSNTIVHLPLFRELENGANLIRKHHCSIGEQLFNFIQGFPLIIIAFGRVGGEKERREKGKKFKAC